MSEKYIIAIDLDGTLLHNDDQPSQFTIETLQKVSQLGHMVIITTGRSYASSMDIYRLIGISSPLINSNGAYCHFPSQSNWEGTQLKAISLELAREIFNLTQQTQLGYLALETLNHVYITSNEALKSPYFELYGKDPILLNSPQELTEQPIAFYWLSTPSQQPKIQQLIAEQISEPLEICTWGGEFPSLDITPYGVTKAFGIKHVAMSLGMEDAPIIAFGDSDNDVSMLEYANIGIAMGNANENVKRVADIVLELTNEEDGVAHYLKKYFNIN